MGGGAYSGIMTAARQGFERASADRAMGISTLPRFAAVR